MRQLFHIIMTATMSLFVMYGCCTQEAPASASNLVHAKNTLDSIFKFYGNSENCLLTENFPHDTTYSATYLATEDNQHGNTYSYLWPFSGILSAVSEIIASDPSYLSILEAKVLPGLMEYYDDTRKPAAFSSYIKSAPKSDRFYDDNIWIGIDFCNLYQTTEDERFLSQARLIWKFIESGMDAQLGGGVFWCEQNRASKHTCSNAPAAVYALKLHLATRETHYLNQAKELYAWTRNHLLDTTDYVYFDNINLRGEISKAKFAYNTGQMVQAAALLYQITGENTYLQDAQKSAKACHEYFFKAISFSEGEQFRIIKPDNVWFSAVMLRGLIELYGIDHNDTYLRDVQKSLDCAWKFARDEYGLFQRDYCGYLKDDKKWLLTQAAMCEMYAQMSKIKIK